MNDGHRDNDSMNTPTRQRELSFIWRLTKRAFSYFNPNSGLGAVRMFILINMFIFGWLMGVEYEKDTLNYSIDYPPSYELNTQEVWISIQKGRGSGYILAKIDNGDTLIVDPTRTREILPISWFRDEQSRMVWHKATVTIFRMSSGSYWLASVKINGHQLADYKKRKNVFYEAKARLETGGVDRIYKFFSLYGYYLGFIIILLAYLTAGIKLRRESMTHG